MATSSYHRQRNELQQVGRLPRINRPSQRNPSPQVLTSNCPGGSTSITRATTQPGKVPWHNNNPFAILPLRDPLGLPFSGLVIQHKQKDYYPDKFGNLKVSNETMQSLLSSSNGLYFRAPPLLSSAIFATGARDGDKQYSGQ